VTDATDRLVVDINREGPRSLAAPESVTVDRSFTVDLRNHGAATHVHLHLDDALSAVARLGNANHHVPSESRRQVQVHVTEPDDGYEPTSGRLKVAIGYGQETRFVDLTVDLSAHEPVTVDPELSVPGGDGGRATPRAATMPGPNPGGNAGNTTTATRGHIVRTLPGVVLGALALALGAAAALVQAVPALPVGGLAVAAAVLAAGYLLLT
jgi:hypothetical protein